MQDTAFFSSFEDLQASGYRADDNVLASPPKLGQSLPFPFVGPHSCAVAPAGDAVSLLSIESKQDHQEIVHSSQTDVGFKSIPIPPTLIVVSPTNTNVSNTYSRTEAVTSQDKIACPPGAGHPMSSERCDKDIICRTAIS